MKKYILFAGLLISAPLFGMENHDNLVDTKGLPKAVVLRALVVAAKPDKQDPVYPKSLEQFAQLLDKNANYIYAVNGKPIKVNFTQNIIDVSAYNHEHGQGVAQEAINTLKNLKDQQRKEQQRTLSKLSRL